MHDWFTRGGRRTRLINWLGIDSWIDSYLAETWQGAQEKWNAASSYFARFRLAGWRRAVNEVASEAFTLGVGGFLMLYALAIPAFVEFDENKINQVQYAVQFLDRNGNEIGKRGILHNDAVPLDEIPDVMIKSTMATEDRRFYEHYGVDFIGTFRALVANVNAGETVQGGSTLTQQLAKNLFLSSERSFQRKIKEVFLAFLLESRFTKREILKLYLDRAYMGGGAFGVEAASQFYFNKSIREVNLAEAAMLAGLFKAPTKYAPHANLPAARGRANDVLSNLVEAGYMTAGQVQNARLNPATPVDTRTANSPEWFLDWAFEEAQRLAAGKGQFVLTARTTVDLGLQQSADQALVSTIRQHGRGSNVRAGALISMEPDGAVRALVGGPDYGESQYNRATHSRRQPGSSFKLYVYAAAMEHGFTPRSVVRDSPVSCGNWSPKNYSGSHGSGGSYTLADAFKQSLNTIAVDLSLNKLGKDSRDKVIEMTQRLGVVGVRKTCSMALGDYGISPLQHTGAYATFANGGKLAIPYAITEMYAPKGELVYSRDRDEAPAPQVIKPQHAAYMNQMMNLVVTDGTAKKAGLDFTHAAGKTGTTSSYRDAWFVGFTGALVTGVWLGNDDYKRMSGITGGSLPAVMWHQFMSVAHPNRNIPTIPGLTPHPAQVYEQQRLAELRRTEPQLAAAQSAVTTQRRNSLMPDPTREALKRLADAMRKVAGGGESPAPAIPAPTGGPPRPSPASIGPADKTPPALPERRAETPALPGRTAEAPRPRGPTP